MGGVIRWRDDPSASAALVHALAPLTLALVTCALALFRSYAGGLVTTARQAPAHA